MPARNSGETRLSGEDPRAAHVLSGPHLTRLLRFRHKSKEKHKNPLTNRMRAAIIPPVSKGAVEIKAAVPFSLYRGLPASPGPQRDLSRRLSNHAPDVL